MRKLVPLVALSAITLTGCGIIGGRPQAPDEFQVARNALASQDLKPLQATARERGNIFAALMDAVKTHSLGQISHALYEVGGEYRRNM